MAQAAPWAAARRATRTGQPVLGHPHCWRSWEGDAGVESALPPGVCFLERAPLPGPSPSAEPHLPETLTFLSPWAYLASHLGLGSLN